MSLIFRAQTTFYFDILDQNVAIGAGSLGFDSRIGQIGHSIANAHHRCDVSSETGPATRYTLWRNSASEDLIVLKCKHQTNYI